MLDGRGAILETAHDISEILRAAGVSAPVIGGIAVVLHGYVRTTTDVDLVAIDSTNTVGQVLIDNGFIRDPIKKEYMRGGVPVHLVRSDQVGFDLGSPVEIDGITTVSLTDLIEMKMRTGLKFPSRAQDMGDVVGLIRHRQLCSDFADDLDESLQPGFRKLVKAIASEQDHHN